MPLQYCPGTSLPTWKHYKDTNFVEGTHYSLSLKCAYASSDSWIAPLYWCKECQLTLTLPCETILSRVVARHTDCSLQTLLFGDPKLNHKQNCDIFWCRASLYYLIKTVWLIPLCGVLLHSTLPPLTAPPHLSLPHSKQAEPMTSEICIILVIVSQLSRNKYCLTQHRLWWVRLEKKMKSKNGKGKRVG